MGGGGTTKEGWGRRRIGKVETGVGYSGGWGKAGGGGWQSDGWRWWRDGAVMLEGERGRVVLLFWIILQF